VGNGARAVRDGQGGGLGDGVGLASVGEKSGKRAVGGESSDDLSNPDWRASVHRRWEWEERGAGAGNEESGGNGELHFC